VKRIVNLALLGLVFVLCGCAVTEQSAEDVGTQFQEGMQGRGQVVEMETTSDSFGPMYR